MFATLYRPLLCCNILGQSETVCVSSTAQYPVVAALYGTVLYSSGVAKRSEERDRRIKNAEMQTTETRAKMDGAQNQRKELNFSVCIIKTMFRKTLFSM